MNCYVLHYAPEETTFISSVLELREECDNMTDDKWGMIKTHLILTALLKTLSIKLRRACMALIYTWFGEVDKIMHKTGSRYVPKV